MKTTSIRSAHNSLRHRGQALIGLLVVAALALIYYSFMLGHHTDAEGKEHEGVYAESIDRSQEVVLDSNLGQIRQVIGMYKTDNDGHVPATFDELKHYAKLPAEMWINPVDKKPLIYNPATGAVYAEGNTPQRGFRKDFGAPGSGGPAGVPPADGSGAGAPPAPPAAGVPDVPGVPDANALLDKMPTPVPDADSSMKQ
jgi:hypothetical protein